MWPEKARKDPLPCDRPDRGVVGPLPPSLGLAPLGFPAFAESSFPSAPV